MNFSALYSSIIVVYPLKISLSSNKFNTFKTYSIQDRGHLISETIGISHIFCCFHPLQIDKMIVFDNENKTLCCVDVGFRFFFFFFGKFLKLDILHPLFFTCIVAEFVPL